MKTEYIITLMGIFLFVVIGIVYFSQNNGITRNAVAIDKIVHEHADFKVYINGEFLDFAKEKYMIKAKEVHIEDMNGIKIHKHTSGITLEYFFKTLGFEFNKECFVLDGGESYCNENNKTIKFYVNGKRNHKYGDYKIKDGDKYLISYGNETEEEIQKQLESVKV